MTSNINTHRKKLIFFLIFLVDFCYFGDSATLVLYLTKHCSINLSSAFQLFGSFLTLSAMSAIFIFFLRYLNNSRPDVLYIGCILLGAGHALLSIIDSLSTTLYIALAMIAVAQGMVSFSLGSLITHDYDENIPDKMNHFSLFYLMNILSQISSPFILGFFIEFSRFGEAMLFMFAINSLMAILIIVLAKKVSLKVGGLLTIACAVAGSSMLLHYPSLVHSLVLTLFVVLLLRILFQFFTVTHLERHSILCFLFLHITLLLCIINLRQLSTIITVFIDAHVNRTLFGWTLPTVSILSAETLIVLLFIPFIFNTKIIRNFTYFKSRFFLGLILISLAMLILSMAAFHAQQGKISLLWICLFFFFLAAGEVNLIPNHLFSIAKLIPRKLYDQFIFFSGTMLAVSCYASAVISKGFSNHTLPFITYTENPLENYSHYFKLFFSINMLWITIFIVLGRLLGKSRIPKKLN